MENNPITLFDIWFTQAGKKVSKLPERAALATSSKAGRPSCRMVLLKGYGAEGFTFYTNYNSPKAKELDENPYAALTFHWVETSKQIRIEGKVKRLNPEESDAYFSTRPRQSQLGAWASDQSKELPSRFTLLRKVVKMASKFFNQPVCRPPYWGGYRIMPDKIEFWEEKSYRLHDRFLYEKTADGIWKRTRLYP